MVFLLMVLKSRLILIALLSIEGVSAFDAQDKFDVTASLLTDSVSTFGCASPLKPLYSTGMIPLVAAMLSFFIKQSFGHPVNHWLCWTFGKTWLDMSSLTKFYLLAAYFSCSLLLLLAVMDAHLERFRGYTTVSQMCTLSLQPTLQHLVFGTLSVVIDDTQCEFHAEYIPLMGHALADHIAHLLAYNG
jgi:hypothetical protein